MNELQWLKIVLDKMQTVLSGGQKQDLKQRLVKTLVWSRGNVRIR